MESCGNLEALADRPVVNLEVEKLLANEEMNLRESAM